MLVWRRMAGLVANGGLLQAERGGGGCMAVRKKHDAEAPRSKRWSTGLCP